MVDGDRGTSTPPGQWPRTVAALVWAMIVSATVWGTVVYFDVR
jgi:hypothetical protein